MLKWIESTGKSEEAAIEAALQKLGMDRDEVSVEILAYQKRYPGSKLFVITMDEEETIELDDLKIEAIPIWKWLLTS